MMSKELKEFTREEVATKTSESASWIIIDGLIYNISTFAAMHPGGEKLLRHYAGKDATGLSFVHDKSRPVFQLKYLTILSIVRGILWLASP